MRTKYSDDPSKLSNLLLWSVFLAAVSYLDGESILYDAQIEIDKTTITASSLLSATWYVGLEDLDGTGYWVGVSIHLCFSIDLHREPTMLGFHDVPSPRRNRHVGDDFAGVLTTEMYGSLMALEGQCELTLTVVICIYRL